MHACCRSHSLHTWYVWMLVFFFVIACFVVIRSLLSPFYVNSISFAWSAAAEKKSLIIFCLNWLNHLPATFYSWFHYRRLNIGHTTFDYIYKQIKCLTQHYNLFLVLPFGAANNCEVDYMDFLCAEPVPLTYL